MLSELKIVAAIGKTVYSYQLTKTFKNMGFDLFQTDNLPILVEIEILKTNPDAVIINIDNLSFESINNLVKHISSLDKIPHIFGLYTYDSPVIEEILKIDSLVCIEMPENFTHLCNEIKNVHENTTITESELHNEIKEKIIDICSLFNVPCKLFGYTYIRQALFIASCNDATNLNFSKDIYPLIAKTYNTTPACVERAIRVAINKSWNKTSVHVKNQFFKAGNLKNHQKPTNNEFILTIGSFIHKEYKRFFDKVYSQQKIKS